MFADASEDTMCALAYLRSQPREYSAVLAFVTGKCRVAPMRHLSIPQLKLQAAVTAVRLKEQIVKEHEMKINSCSFWSESNTVLVLQRIHSSHCKQQVLVANRVAEILDRTDVSQWKHVNGINNPADIGTRVIKIEELKRSEWLTGLTCLMRPESERPEQVNLIFASDYIPSSVFMIQAEEKKAVTQWDRFSNFNRPVNTVAYVQRALDRYKTATLVVSIEKREEAEATIFKLYTKNSLVTR